MIMTSVSYCQKSLQEIITKARVRHVFIERSRQKHNTATQNPGLCRMTDNYLKGSYTVYIYIYIYNQNLLKGNNGTSVLKSDFSLLFTTGSAFSLV